MSITLVHTSDWHLGHELFGHSREAEHDAFLEWLLDRLEERQADVLLVTGDVYDVANPPVSAMRRLYAFINAALERCPALRIVIVGGNHDSAARIDLPGALIGRERLHLVGSLPRLGHALDHDALLVPLSCKDGTPGALLAAIPYCRPGDLRADGLAGLYAEVIEEGARRAAGLPLIVTGHLHVAGGDVSELSERRITVGGEEAEAASLFDERCAYVALGHLHRPQWIKGAAKIRYAGSPFPLSATERNYRHSITLVTAGPDGTEAEELPIPRPAAFHAVPKDGAKPLAQVTEAIAALAEGLDPQCAPELRPFVEVSVLTNGPEPHLQAEILQALDALPVRRTRIVRVSDVGNGDGAAADPQPAPEIGEIAPDDIFAALYRTHHEGDPPEELMRAFAELLDEAHGEDA